LEQLNKQFDDLHKREAEVKAMEFENQKINASKYEDPEAKLKAGMMIDRAEIEELRSSR
jgi:hypothetical protein